MFSDKVRRPAKAGAIRYSYLVACISEADGSYLLQVTLYDSHRRDAAWGEETADTFEQASAWVGALASEFSIASDCIEIELRMDNLAEGTRH